MIERVIKRNLERVIKRNLKRFNQWNKNRIQENYDKVISQYSPEDQEKIEKGRNVLLTDLSKDDFENKTNLTTSYLSDKKMAYDKLLFLGLISYKSNVLYWRDLGNLETDIMFSVPLMRVGPDGFQISIGRPARIVGGRATRTSLYEIPFLAIGRDMLYLIKKLEERNLIE